MWKFLEKCCVVVTVAQIIWGILQSFDLVPTEIRFVKKPDIKPIVHLYPGSKIRLKPELRSDSETEIEDISWTLKGKSSTTILGLEPVVSLPPQGGLYNLEVKAKMHGGIEKFGQTSFYVVQTESQKVSAAKNVEIKVDVAALIGKNVEVYAGDTAKPTVGEILRKSEGTYLKIDKGEAFSLVLGKVFFRETSGVVGHDATTGVDTGNIGYKPASANMNAPYKAVDVPDSVKTNLSIDMPRN